MSRRSFVFRAGATELVLPVTPSSYQVETGINVEVINIHELGDAILTGYGTLATIAIDCMCPANSYPFTDDDDPDPYISQFEEWVRGGTRLRFIIGGTGVNLPVVVQSIAYGEQDGTNDVYAKLTLREYRQLEAIQISTAPAATLARVETSVKPTGESGYTIVAGDTLSAICRKYYGDSSPATYNKLAQYNGISNPHLIFAGKTLKLPQPLV